MDQRVPSTQEVTRLLLRWSKGERDALDQLIPIVYHELRRQARRLLVSERPGHTLQTTALVNEAYLRLVDQRRASWVNRAQFFAVAAHLMRRILLDHARRKRARKREKETVSLSSETLYESPNQPDIDVLLLDQLLNRLAEFAPREARLVELRFFAGLTIEETAQVLEVSPSTVQRDWLFVKAWLHRELTRKPKSTPE